MIVRDGKVYAPHGIARVLRAGRVYFEAIARGFVRFLLADASGLKTAEGQRLITREE